MSGRMLIVISSDGRQKSVPLGGINTEVLACLLLNRFGSRRVCVALDFNLTIGTGPLPLIQESPGAATNITLVDRSGGHAGDNPARRRVALRRANQL